MNGAAIRHIGDDALALPAPDRALRHALADVLRASGAWVDVVPGKQEVTVHFDPLEIAPSDAVAALARQAAALELQVQARGPAIRLTLQVDADSAPDLARLAADNGLSTPAFLARLTARPLTVDMMGFMPGFAYVEGVDLDLTAERLAAPRQRVAAGSVGMLTGQLGLYAFAGPAGWPIIGRIGEVLFDAGRAEPFLLKPGMQIDLVLEGHPA